MKKKTHGLAFPVALRNDGARLMDLQMWFLGQDVTHSSGNLLQAYGFEKVPSQVPKRASLYRRDGMQVWSWGIWCSVCGAVYLPRQTFAPLYSPSCDLPTVWRMEDLPTLRAPQTAEEVQEAHRATCAVCRLWADYENWIRHNMGDDYRRSLLPCYPSYKQSKGHLPQNFAYAWDKLAERLAHEAL
jgi:hypothetical protein